MTRKRNKTSKVQNMAVYKDHRQPTPTPEGEIKTAENGAHPQAKAPTTTAKTLEAEEKALDKANIVGTRNPHLACKIHCSHTIIATTLEEEKKASII